jgi:hypothetical protein
MHDDYRRQASPTLETTVLYGLRPRAEGTGDVESLFSYFLRLAHEHRLTPKKLVDVVLRDVVGQIPQLTHWRIGWGWDKNGGRDIISSGLMAQRWVEVLGVATGQAGLEWATLLGLAKHVSGDLLDADERVCPQCLAEDVAGDQLPYGRLLWRMKAVTCCPAHGCRLVLPTCGRGVSTTRAQFSRVKLSGVCNQCGSIGHRCMSVQAELATEDEVWRAEQCRQLIAALPAIAASEPRAVPQCMRAYCVEPGSLTSLALRSGATISVLSRWMNEPTARLSFDQLLDICGVERLDLAALLQGRLEKPHPGRASVEPVRTKRRLVPVDHDRVRAALTEAIQSGESVTRIAERLRVDVATLAQHKELYDQVRRETRERKAAAISARQDAAIASAEAVAVKLVQGKMPLTHRNALRAGSRSYPSDTAAAVLAMIRIGLGDRTVRYPAIAARMGEPFMAKIELAVQRVGAAAGVPQARLPLEYR